MSGAVFAEEMRPFSGSGLPVPGVDLEEHVLQAGLGAQQRGGVLLDVALVLGLQLQLDHGLAVLELDLADLADLHAGGAHRLALTRLDGLGVGQLYLHAEGLLLDEGEAQALVGQDVPADPEPEHEQREDRDEVAEVLSDRARHLLFAPSFESRLSSFAKRSLRFFPVVLSYFSWARAACWIFFALSGRGLEKVAPPRAPGALP